MHVRFCRVYRVVGCITCGVGRKEVDQGMLPKEASGTPQFCGLKFQVNFLAALTLPFPFPVSNARNGHVCSCPETRLVGIRILNKYTGRTIFEPESICHRQKSTRMIHSSLALQGRKRVINDMGGCRNPSNQVDRTNEKSLVMVITVCIVYME